ncbi:uncharacterized protein LOC123192033 [Mangifera indica]|uniref:uncharacterized protein LOC123192033 n=1 Tax=Mangifera indica TaxID=29780 RepID=UPI001CFA853A|nr:uncharacterized protein LOC123192033 [Mangifera indica]
MAVPKKDSGIQLLKDPIALLKSNSTFIVTLLMIITQNIFLSSCGTVLRGKTNKKLGGSQPTGTPSLAWSCVVVIVSLLSGASVVHNIYKPDLVILLLRSLIRLQIVHACKLFD